MMVFAFPVKKKSLTPAKVLAHELMKLDSLYFGSLLVVDCNRTSLISFYIFLLVLRRHVACKSKSVKRLRVFITCLVTDVYLVNQQTIY